MGLSARLTKQVDGFDLSVDFSIGNELVVLFGSSGAGKTMTLKLIAGLMKPTAGRVTLNGTVLFDSASRVDVKPQSRSIGYVFQNHSLFPHMTVLKNIMFGARGIARREQRELAAQLIDKLRLEGLENKLPSEISGGQQQRTALARAIIKQPSALLLDEPFSALDRTTRRRMGECLGEAMRELAIPILLVTHDVEEAHSLADRVLVMEAGRVVRTGESKEVIERSAPAGVEGSTAIGHARGAR